MLVMTDALQRRRTTIRPDRKSDKGWDNVFRNKCGVAREAEPLVPPRQRWKGGGLCGMYG
jgi:hypothetical protein